MTEPSRIWPFWEPDPPAGPCPHEASVDDCTVFECPAKQN